MPSFTMEDVARHKSRSDLWVVIHGKVYDVTKYVQDHPGGPDLLVDVAGQDGTAAYEDVGHSEDAGEILGTYLIGDLEGAIEYKRLNKVRVVKQSTVATPATKGKKTGVGKILVATSALAGLLSLCYSIRIPTNLSIPTNLRIPNKFLELSLPHGGFVNGFAAATLISVVAGSLVASRLSKLTQLESGFTKYPPRIKSTPIAKPNPHLAAGFLQAKEYKLLPLIKKDLLAPNVYRFVFQLPRGNDVIGLPIGQHVAIKATINGQLVSRSYTPTSNNLDLGVLELVIKCYPDGLLTGQYLANLKIGDKVPFRGPKGAMRYKKGLCKKIGMIAGGTGITPMYQLIRAICENDTDTTEISLIYANRSEEDILLRQELERFAAEYPKNLKIWYMLDNPPPKWAYGKGYVTAALMKEWLPGPSDDAKIMLCGPPGMVNASKKALVSLGFQAPGAISRMTDQIFSF
ncbi:hypothetical protein UA08_02940 [Talaromyces atroroseus]|uniref:NADH-cytochrome b5 reductase 1 n=1 Tax=Talaromyces atroroseus TaxID=1441469 RepID=A0A225AKI2_TALAT|nr:hypothetical protein UA08_02940 [Talaromyces atroroseus]OKL62042.1 hypothetical protein UA08_02940 [Talaromyces atroroseus]